MPRNANPTDLVSKAVGGDGTELTVVQGGFVAAVVRRGMGWSVGVDWPGSRSSTSLTAADLTPTAFHGTRDQAVAEVERHALHQAGVTLLGRRQEAKAITTAAGKPVRTPWGPAQSARIYGEGVTSYGTAGHGGFKLSARANAKVPAPLRVQGGWYEEHLEWASVAHALPELFTPYEREVADRTLRNWKPDEYEAATGQVVPMEESSERRRRAFDVQHADSMRVTSATLGKGHPGMVVVTARRGGREGTDADRRFLAPCDEYEARHEDLDQIDDAPAPVM